MSADVATKQQTQRTMTATAIIAQKRKSRRVYVNINGRDEIVFGVKVEENHIVVFIWGDDINNLEPIELPLNTELIVL